MSTPVTAAAVGFTAPSQPPAQPVAWSRLVWQRFRVRRPARFGLYSLVTLYTLACLAPFLCNQKPFYWCTTSAAGTVEWAFPLWRDFFHPENGIDFVFNAMALFWALYGLTRLALLVPGLRGSRHTGWRKYAARTVGGLGVAAMFLWSMATTYRLDSADYYGDHLALVTRDPAHTALFAPVAYGPTDQIVTEKLQAPGWWQPLEKSAPGDTRTRWLGTDNLGRDLFARVLHGTRISLSVGFVSVGIALVIGLLFGALAGYYAGWIDLAICRFIEIVICIPTFFLILLVLATVRNPGILWIMLILGLTGWPGIARLVRGEFLRLRTLDFVAAARALGLSDRKIILNHILPNALGPVYVAVSFGVAGAVLLETSLSFLGIGVQPPTPSWGEALHQAYAHIEQAWWLVLFPGIAILTTVLSFNLVGDGLRDAFDPRTSGGGRD
ncbi:MAG TPA: ABC transporter permease [Planctomycetota bacterium]|nr:ABC transporter permease [Planctomycetota bacterium]